MIQELIQTLTPQEKDTLRLKVNTGDSNLYKLIKAVLDDPKLTKEQIQKKFKINENTYFKNISLAKDEIYEVIKQHLKNSYDDLVLTNVLYRRGLDVQANKLRLKLETEYDRKGWWGVLNELYSMEMLVAYTKCDIPRMKQVRDKAFKNAGRVQRYITVDREAIVQMAIIEKGEIKEKDFDAYAANMNSLLKQARETGHHIPVFNALHSLFVLYTKYKIDIKLANEIIKEMQLLIKNYGDTMIPYTINAASLNAMGFHVDFLTSEKPLTYIKKVDEAIGMHGLLYDAEALIAFCSYYFLKGDKANFSKRLAQFERVPHDKSFDYKSAYLHCLQAYLNVDPKSFNTYLNDFYSDNISREYNDHDLMLRYLEMLILIKEKNYSLATDKLEATIKFTRRNFTSSRVEIEKTHWEMIRTAIQGKAIKKPLKLVFRHTEFLFDELNSGK